MSTGISMLLGLLLVAVLPARSVAFALDTDGMGFTRIDRAGDIAPNPSSVVTDQFVREGVVFGKPGVSAGVAVVVEDSFAPSTGVSSVVGLDDAGMIPGIESGTALGDIYFHFVVPGTAKPTTTDLVSFTLGDEGRDEDVFEVRAYDVTGKLISRQTVSGDSRFDVNVAAPGIHRVEVDFKGQAGYSLDDLEFVVNGPDDIA